MKRIYRWLNWLFYRALCPSPDSRWRVAHWWYGKSARIAGYFHSKHCDYCIRNSQPDPAELAYWNFDARRKGLGPWKGMPMSERDAFKAEYRATSGMENQK